MGIINYKKEDEPKIRIPKKIQDTIEIEEVYKDGIFGVGKGKFSKTYQFQDINFQLKNDEEQEKILNKYCNMINSLEVDFKITINNKNRNMHIMEEQSTMKKKNDGFDEIREEYNRMILEKIKDGKQGVEQQKYFTVSCYKKNIQEAKLYFNVVETNLKKCFSEMGSILTPLNAEERMRILHDFYRMGEEEYYNYNFDEFVGNGKNVIDYVSPAMLQFKSEHFYMNDKVCRVAFIKDYGTGIPTDFITKLTELPGHMILSIEAVPIPKNEARNAIHNLHTKIEEDIIKEQQVRNKQGNYSTDISYQKRSEKAVVEELLDDMNDNNERLFWVTTLIMLIADSKEELDQHTGSLISVAAGCGCQIDKHYFMQRKAMNTTLPIGVRQVKYLTSMQSTSLTGLVPFNSQDIYDPGGIYYGRNDISKNIIMANRKKLRNGNGFVFATSGSGKSMFVKDEATKVFLSSDDDIIIIDPEDEYKNLADEFNGETIKISPATNNHINPFDVYDDVTIDDLSNKADFVMSVIDQLISGEISPGQKSIISRVVQNIYKPLMDKETSEPPTMTDFYEELKRQPEDEAKELVLCLEVFVTGTLNVFAHKTNIDINNRFIVYGIKELGKQLWSIGMFVMLENIATRINENRKQGKNTWLYIDEIYVLFSKEYSAQYLYELWKRIRKSGGLATGITQNVEDTLQSYKGRTMVANSEFIVLLQQAPNDIDRMQEVINISDAQLQYVQATDKGTGLIKFGQIIIPFDNRIKKGSKLYDLFNTDLKS